jgi:acetolactate synthase-1/2/3 large subunit
MQHCSVRAIGDTEIAIPELTRIIRSKMDADSSLKSKFDARAKRTGQRHDETWAKWQEAHKKNWDLPSRFRWPRLAHEIWEVIKDEDWVLAAIR